MLEDILLLLANIAKSIDDKTEGLSEIEITNIGDTLCDLNKDGCLKFNTEVLASSFGLYTKVLANRTASQGTKLKAVSRLLVFFTENKIAELQNLKEEAEPTANKATLDVTAQVTTFNPNLESNSSIKDLIQNN